MGRKAHRTSASLLDEWKRRLQSDRVRLKGSVMKAPSFLRPLAPSLLFVRGCSCGRDRLQAPRPGGKERFMGFVQPPAKFKGRVVSVQ